VVPELNKCVIVEELVGQEFIFFKTVSVDFKEKSQTLQFPLLHLPRFAEAGKETPVKPMERKK
jgi:hypothetical protein